MKKLLVIGCALFLNSSVFAETINTTEIHNEVVDATSSMVVNANTMQKVIDVPNNSKEEIYLKSKEWIAVNFRSANNVIQLDDKESGIIIGKGNFDFPCNGMFQCMFYEGAMIKFNIKIETKDNRARVTFSNILGYVPPKPSLGEPATEVPFDEMKKQSSKDKIIKQISALSDNLAQTMQKSQIDDNW